MIQKVYWDAVHVTLGCMLKDRSEAAQIFLALRSEDFVEEEHRLIFDTAAALFNADEPITPITIGARTSEEVHTLCKSCLNYVLSPKDWTGYAHIIREQAAMFRAEPLAEQLHKDLVAAASIDDVRQQAEQIVGALGTDTHEKDSFSATELAMLFMQSLDEPVTYLDWGFDKLNRHVLCEKNEYIVIGARPSVGKTAFALQVGLHMAKKKRVGFFSLETDQKKVAGRLFAATSMVEMDAIKHRELSAEQRKALAKAAGEVSRTNFETVKAAGYTVDKIRRKAIAGRMDIVIIDYLQLICTNNPKHDDFTRVSEVSRQLQIMSKELDIVVIALSQLSRNVDKYTEPNAADLRSSGQIEQDADAILMMYIPPLSDLKTEAEKADQETLRWLKIEKCKEGITGKIKMWFNGSIQRFMQAWPDFYERTLEKMPEEKPKQPEYQQMKMR